MTASISIPKNTPLLQIPELTAFQIQEREMLDRYFANALQLPIAQGWREVPEENFRSGNVKLGWHGDSLYVYAQMEDEHVFSEAKADNDHLWALGDVFENFFRDMAGDIYAELHIAPNGKRLQLVFPNRNALGNIPLSELMRNEPVFDFETWHTPTGWAAVAKLPSTVCLSESVSLKDRIWLASFCRYDYNTLEEPPVLSSTSDYTILNYHRQEDWRYFRFV